MKKSTIALTIILFVVVICAITCPGKDEHKEAVVSLVNHKIRSDLKKSGAGCFSILGSMIGSTISERTIENMLEVKDCFIFSFGQLCTKEGKSTVSIGILGHVFTASNETFSKAVDECNDLFD